MKTYECSSCGRSAKVVVWGFTLLARDGWNIAPVTNPPGAAERAWLCDECAEREAAARDALTKSVSTRPAARADSRKKPALRVLVVDDHVLLLRCIARLLSGCETVLTTSPRHALEMLLTGGEFDVIVCDVMMPDVTGPELYERCAACSPDLGRRFLFASSDPVGSRRAIDEAAARVGAGHVLPLLKKPLSRAGLVAAVQAVARGAAHASGTYVLHLPESAEPVRSEPAATKPPRRSSTGFR